MIKADGHAMMGALIAAARPHLNAAVENAGRGVRLIVDRDPVSLL